MYRLEASDDGQQWKMLDEKDGIVFLAVEICKAWLAESKKALEGMGVKYRYMRVVEVVTEG